MLSVTEIQLQPGEHLYREGDGNDFAYIIETGEISLYSGQSKTNEYERRGPGAIIGEYSILTGRPRTVSAIAITDCRIFKIPAVTILEKYAHLDPVLRACIETSIAFASHKEDSAHRLTHIQDAATLANADDVLKQLNFEIDIEKGLKDGQFFMQYQPIVDISNGAISGFESLMRWQHATKGVIPPDQFIPVAEAMGSISDLTQLAIIDTCQTLHELQEADIPNALFASVNISGKDLDRDGFADFLAHALDQHTFEPSRLKLEVTETALVPNSKCAAQNLEYIRSLGCGIAVDDFGTGYSNFAYLKSLPLTALKIDRAFVADILENAVSRSIVRMLVGLGQELNVDIVAEGIETADAVERLRALGCKFGQGYYFFKPMPKDALIALVNPGASQGVAHENIAMGSNQRAI